MSHRMTILFTLAGCIAVAASFRGGGSSSDNAQRPAKTQAAKGERRGVNPESKDKLSREKIRILLTETKIRSIDGLLFLYARDKDGDLPKGRGEKILEALTRKNDLNEDRIFDDKWIDDHKDAWGRPILYEWPTKKWPNAKKPAVWSRGPNGIDENGDGDDIRNWKTSDPRASHP